MEKDYVSFEIAKLIKEKTDFNIPTEYRSLLPWFFCMYDENGEIHWGYYDKEWYPAVPCSIILRWLREKEFVLLLFMVIIQLLIKYFGLHKLIQ